jgi:hypothetical protein
MLTIHIVQARLGGYPFSPGHFISSIIYRDGLTALPWQG